MSMNYENHVHCLSCWNEPQTIYNFIDQNHSYSSTSQPSTYRCQKISLKRKKASPKIQQFLYNPIRTSQPCHISPVSLTYSQEPVITNRQIHNVSFQRPVSNIDRNINVRCIPEKHLERQVFENIREKIITAPIKIEQKLENQLTQTTKIRINKTKKQSSLKQTRKVIPEARHSFEQMSKMKQSVVSICQQQEQPRVQESAIMVDYFNPSASRVSQLKLSHCKAKKSQINL